jgi:membrane peptidoglycan carboxypeptidase
VGEASRFYFNTTPALLSPLQAYYLASLLPNPKVTHFEKQGRLAPGWSKLLRHLMTIAHKRHYLTDDELKVALESDLTFGVADSTPPDSKADTGASSEDDWTDTHEAAER